VFGLVVSSVLITGLVLMNYNASLVDQFNQVILLATLTTLVPYAYSAAAQVALWAHDRAAFTARVFWRDTVIASLAFAYSLWAIWGAGIEVIAKGFMLLLVGVPVYVWLTRRRKAEEPLTLPPEWTTRAPESRRVPVTHH
jgi:APA family basic amino acid/polyamine antiporter